MNIKTSMIFLIKKDWGLSHKEDSNSVIKTKSLVNLKQLKEERQYLLAIY